MTKLIIIVCLIGYLLADEQCSSVNSICVEKNNCQECIRAHHCCVWCYEENNKRCVAKGTPAHNQCKSDFIEDNLPTKVEIIKNVSFTDVEDDVSKTVQFKPGEFNIDLRYGEPVNITIHYRPARNYPLDLYYLMDLTLSMEPDLNILKELGSELTTLLTKLTKNHRIAFGSYIDKPEMPFYRTDPTNKENPCSSEGGVCERAYLFKHHLNFTDNINIFISQVNASLLSANSDDPEGGIDALMQIVLCGEKLGWDKMSRKLVIVATGGGMHLAGDGILAGYSKRNIDKCWIDNEGSYLPGAHYDYPSLEEIYHQLKSKKINFILAAKSTIYDYYKEMEKLLKETIRVEKLAAQSNLVLNVVREGYYNFIKQVHLNMNTTHINGLAVDFFADCNRNGQWKRESNCNNAEEGKEMDFKVQFTLNEYQKISSEEAYIEENNINDKIKINFRFVGSTCECAHMTQSNKVCSNGELVCGDCVCSDGWAGESCSTECKNDYSMCRFVADGVTSLTCSTRGDCICSKCICYSPRYQGQYCEYECPYNRQTNQICEGHGDCINGTCICHENYSDENCGCHNSVDSCKIPGFISEDVCNGKGLCPCNKCNCEEGYSGQYCEICDECKGLCDNYLANVTDFIIKGKTPTENNTIRIEAVEDLPEDERFCVHRYNTEDGKKCDIFYKYEIRNDRSVDITATKPICNQALAAGIVAAMIIAAFLALAILIIIIWKGRNWYRDKKEYEAFLKNSEDAGHREENPLYRNPVVEYRNPIELRTFHDKNE